MDFPSSPPDFIRIISFLLPGFVAAWLFHNLTAHPRLSPFERSVQALIFTAFIQVFVAGLYGALIAVGGHWYTIGRWGTHVEFAWSLAIAVGLGGLTSYVVNNDLLHRRLRKFPTDKMSVTRQTSFPTEWFSAFNSHSQYVILHISGSRRVYGWPEEWPNEADLGHFALENAEWLFEGDVRAPLHHVKRLLIRAEDVKMVEILKEPFSSLTAEQERKGIARLLHGKTSDEDQR